MIAAAFLAVLIGQSNLTRDDGVTTGFSQRWGELTGQSVEVVNCAQPDTRIAQWQRSWVRTTLYADCLAAISGRQVNAVIFWQGENDAMQQAWAQGWAKGFLDTMGGLRTDLGYPVPLGVAVLHDGPSSAITPYWNTVRALQRNLCAPGLSLVSTDGVNYPDGIHADYAGHVEIGKRFAEALTSLTPP